MTSPTSTRRTDPGASCRMLQAFLDGYRATTTLIYIAAKLSLPDLLADGPQSSDTFCESWSSSARRTHERAAGPNNSGAGASFLGGPPLPPAGLSVGTLAPAFALTGLDERMLTLEALRAAGKPVLLTFIDPNCGPCDALLPELAQW